MNRLARLRAMRDWIDEEIAAELAPTTRDAVYETAELYGVAPADVLGGSRMMNVCRARQGACWLLRRGGMAYAEIGRTLGIDHSTAIYAFRKIEGTPAVRSLLLQIEAA